MQHEVFAPAGIRPAIQKEDETMGTEANFGMRSMTIDEILTSLARSRINKMPEEKRAAAWASFKEQVLDEPGEEQASSPPHLTPT